jgi:hypothetical protein
MADAILLSQDTYDRLMKMLVKWEKGDIITPSIPLTTIETGTGYQKLGFDAPNVGSISTLALNVCIDGSPVMKNFLISI